MERWHRQTRTYAFVVYFWSWFWGSVPILDSARLERSQSKQTNRNKPIPHVLILVAMVVVFALIIRIKDPLAIGGTEGRKKERKKTHYEPDSTGGIASSDNAFIQPILSIICDKIKSKYNYTISIL